MRYIFFFLVFLSYLAGTAQNYDKPINKESKLILKNTIFSNNDFSKIKGLEGFTKVSDTSFYKEKSYKEYAVKHLKKEQTHIVLLIDRLTNENGNRTGEQKILNHIALNLSASEGLSIGYCGEPNSWDIEALYAVKFDIQKLKTTKNIPLSILNIWKIEEENGFQVIDQNDNFNCIEVDYLLQELGRNRI